MRLLSRFQRLSLVLIAVVAASTVLVPARTQAQQQPLRILNVVNGSLGDKSFYDSAQRGLERAKADLGIQFKTIELTDDTKRWEPGLIDAMANTNDYDILITGTYEMAAYLTKQADNYPDKKFISYDTGVDYTQCKCANVYSVEFAQNEGSYVAGVYVAAMLKDGKLPNLAGKKTIAAIGGQDAPVINDFIVGYEQGAKSIDPQITVLKQYINGDQPYFDPAKGKEEALALYDQGADVIFGIAGDSGKGVIEAAKERGRYAIGVDSDQATILMATDPKAAAQVLTSMQKNVDNTLYRAIKLAQQGKLPFGQLEQIGLAEGGVGLSKNDIYNKITPDSVKQVVNQAEADVIACKIKVATAFEKSRPCVAPVATAAATMGATASPTMSATAVG